MSKLRQLLGKSGGQEPGHAVTGAPIPVPPPEEFRGVLDTYRVPAGAKEDASAEIIIVEESGVGRYLVRPPRLDAGEAEALRVLRTGLVDSIPVEAEGDPRQGVSEYAWKTAEGTELEAVAHASQEKQLYYLMREFTGFWEIDALVDDDNLEEISVSRYDRPVRVLHRDFREYMFMETDIVFPSEERLQAFIRRLAQLGGTTISLAQPSLEVTLHGASDRRVTATLGDEISRPGSTFAIRKQRERPITLAQLASPENARWPALGTRASPDQGPSYEEVH